MPRSLGKFSNDSLEEEVDFQESPSMPRKLEMPKKEQQDISKVRSLIGAPIKGAVKEFKSEQDKLLSFLGIDPQQKETSGEFEERVEGILPTKEGFLEEGLERGGRYAPYAALGGGSIGAILRSIGAGIAGQAGEDIGLGPLGQTILEIGAQGAPGLAKRIVGKNPAQRKIIDFARSKGLSEEQIAPLLQGGKKAKGLGSLAYKGRKVQEKLREGRRGIGTLYESVKNNPEAAQAISNEAGTKLLNEMYQLVMDVPSDQRQKILADFIDLAKGGFTGKELINFYQDINYLYGRGNRALGGLLEPVSSAIESISPQVANEFRMTNELFKNFLNLSRRLRPNQFEGLMKLGRKGRIIAGLALHNPFLLAESIGEAGVKKLATEMLTNPRFQNISTQIIDALNKGKYAVARQIADKALEDFKEEE